MESKRPLARRAARASAGFALAGLVLFLAQYGVRLRPAGMPEVYAHALLTMAALGVCLCLLVSIGTGVGALCGVKRHGKTGIVGPAVLGLVLSGLMLVPIVKGVNDGIAAQARERQGGTVPASSPKR